MKRSNYLGMLCLYGIMLLICLTVPVTTVDKARGALLISPESYRTATGTVVRSVIVPDKHEGDYYYDIAYKYTVTGKTYTSTSITFGDKANQGKWFAKKYVERYPLGRKVPVLYLPDQPDFSVLEPDVVGPTKKLIAVRVVMTVTALAGVAWCCLGLRRLKREAAAQN